jgi:hypothetical protein
MKNFVTIRFSRQRALELDLLWCECGHRPNNHYDLEDGGCAHCSCEKYRERATRGGHFVSRKVPKNTLAEKLARFILRLSEGDDVNSSACRLVKKHFPKIYAEYE